MKQNKIKTHSYLRDSYNKKPERSMRLNQQINLEYGTYPIIDTSDIPSSHNQERYECDFGENDGSIVWSDLGLFWGTIVDYSSRLQINHHRLSMVDKLGIILRTEDAGKVMQYLPDVRCNLGDGRYFYVSEVSCSDILGDEGYTMLRMMEKSN